MPSNTNAEQCYWSTMLILMLMNTENWKNFEMTYTWKKVVPKAAAAYDWQLKITVCAQTPCTNSFLFLSVEEYYVMILQISVALLLPLRLHQLEVQLTEILALFILLMSLPLVLNLVILASSFNIIKCPALEVQLGMDRVNQETNALSYCLNKIIFVQDKMKFVRS